MKNKRKQSKDALSEQLAFRVPKDLRKFYEGLAAAEKRKLSDTLRIALEDRANQLREQAAA